MPLAPIQMSTPTRKQKLIQTLLTHKRNVLSVVKAKSNQAFSTDMLSLARLALANKGTTRRTNPPHNNHALDYAASSYRP